MGWTSSDGWDCQQVITRLCMLLDQGKLDAIDDSFCDNPVVHLFGEEVTGIKAVRALFASRIEGRITRHATSPSLVEARGAGDEAWVRTYVTVYRADLTAEPGPAPLEGPVNVVEYEDDMVRENGQWKIRTRQIRMIFLKPAA